MTYFKEFVNRFNKDHDNKIKAYSKISSPLPIFMIFNNSEKEKERETDYKYDIKVNKKRYLSKKYYMILTISLNSF